MLNVPFKEFKRSRLKQYSLDIPSGGRLNNSVDGQVDY